MNFSSRTHSSVGFSSPSVLSSRRGIYSSSVSGMRPVGRHAVPRRNFSVRASPPQENGGRKSLEEIHPWDIEEFRRNAHETVDFIADYYKAVQSKEFPVRSEVQPGYLPPLLPTSAPEEGEPFSAIMSDIKSKIVPGVTHWQHPSFFAYFSANSSYPGMIGEFLSAAFNVIGFSWVGSPACTELETVAMDWLAELLGLPPAFLYRSGTGGGGVIQGTASEAVLVALLAARTRTCGPPPSAAVTPGSSDAGAKAVDSKVPRLVAYTSDQAHSCVKKACMIGSIEHLRLIPARKELNWAIDPRELEAQIQRDKEAGLIPFFVCANLGTTSSGAVDPIAEIAEIAKKNDMWSHVDAAYAGSALVLPEMRHFAKGMDKVDSFCFNPHKWLLVNFDCSALYVRDRTPLMDALSLTPEFLRNKATDSGAVIDYKDLQIPLGRRFRALKLWIVLRSYGAKNIREYIRHHVSLARSFESLVRSDGRFELVTPTNFSLVCFRLRGGSTAHGNEASRLLLDKVNATGKVFLTHTVLGGVYTIRLAVGGAYTQWKDVQEAFDLLAAGADGALREAEVAMAGAVKA